ncbi:hypothetical protein LCGC14_0598190 [marine sediment metagenome]|uniref:Uncharacterized protein n=1 Tax=marine sediment metagenome TaxID=412755 RepID=A0A0F9RBI2_9ZZZZ
MKTNILVQYQGGGYDGCFWEWNYFYIDKQGTFHDIQSSGRAGIDNKQDAEQFIRQDKNKTYIYDMNNEQDIITFSNESHPVHVSGVLQWFEDNPDTGIKFFVVCSECKCHIDSDELVLDENKLFCDECYTTGFCSCCESYVGETEIVQVDAGEHYGHDYICVDCKEYHDEERETESLEDLRWQAFCTGKPDMFSGKLREERLSTGELPKLLASSIRECEKALERAIIKAEPQQADEPERTG